MKKLALITAAAAMAFAGAAQAGSTNKTLTPATSASKNDSSSYSSAGLSLDRTQIQLIQYGLTESGFAAGGADGAWGGQTAKALKAYQASVGASQTGTLNTTQACALISVGIGNHGSSQKLPGFCSSN